MTKHHLNAEIVRGVDSHPLHLDVLLDDSDSPRITNISTACNENYQLAHDLSPSLSSVIKLNILISFKLNTTF
ncbi:subtilisin-like protease SBT2.5 [Iris pallida]|uniref:Subtilisin-like protease SBT2.5 n=1 Tax=Iris pallida TaxID=29817 RepID=A0AAX6DGZ9_IRIPA|nr:subtilisin-like protease SBT2.5 [Iris pallida]